LQLQLQHIITPTASIQLCIGCASQRDAYAIVLLPDWMLWW